MTDRGLSAMRMHSRPEFEAWLAIELEVRDELAELMGEDLGIGPGSLGPLEAFLLARYQGPHDALRLDQRGVLDAAARQVGLVMVLGVDGAAWDIDLTDEDDVYYRLPVVVIAGGVPQCPLTLVTTALHRRTGDFLTGVLERLARKYNQPAGS